MTIKMLTICKGYLTENRLTVTIINQGFQLKPAECGVLTGADLISHWKWLKQKKKN